MKALIAVVLALSILAAQAQTNEPCVVAWGPPVTPTIGAESTFVICFMVGCCLACGVYIIWKVKGCTPDQNAPLKFVLEKTHDFGTYTPVCTNTVILNGTNAIDLFQIEIQRDGDSTAFYRARWLRP